MLTRNFVIYFLLAQILVLLSNVPLILHQTQQSPNSVFPLVHTEWTHDYYLYLSVVTQGKEGAWLYRESYTSEPTKPGFFLMYYIVVGKLAAMFNLWQPVAYHISRVFSLELFLILVYVLSYQILGKRWAWLGSVFSVASGLAPSIFFKEAINLTTYPSGYPWWIAFDTLERLNGIPHHIFGQAMLLLTFIMTIHFVRTGKLRFAALSALTTVVGGLLFPPILAPIVICIPLTLIIYFVRNFLNKKHSPFSTFSTFSTYSTFLKSEVFGLGLITLAALTAYFLVIWQQNQGFPWDQWATNEVIRWNQREPNFNYTLLLIFGILSLVGFPSFLKFLFSKLWERIFVALWVVFPFMLLPFATLLSIPKIRLLQTVPFVPLGVLAAATVCELIRVSKRYIIRIIITLAVITAGLSTTILLFRQRLATVAMFGSGSHYHIPRTTYSAIEFIDNNIPQNSLILAESMMSNIIPAFTPMRSYVGHFTHTMNYYEKESRTRSFYAQTLSEADAKKLLTDNGISYIYFGENERLIPGASGQLKYTFIEPIYDRDNVIVYKIKPAL